jgi:hypothetical protein
VAKKYKLEMEPYSDSNGDPIFASKGHHDPDLFLDAARKEYDDKVIDGKVEHVYLRCTPAPKDSDHGYLLHDATPGPGAFPVTRLKEI